jgi:hypothetical protein
MREFPTTHRGPVLGVGGGLRDCDGGCLLRLGDRNRLRGLRLFIISASTLDPLRTARNVL